jgi:hypothetical protein
MPLAIERRVLSAIPGSQSACLFAFFHTHSQLELATAFHGNTASRSNARDGKTKL